MRKNFEHFLTFYILAFTFNSIISNKKNKNCLKLFGRDKNCLTELQLKFHRYAKYLGLKLLRLKKQ